MPDTRMNAKTPPESNLFTNTDLCASEMQEVYRDTDFIACRIAGPALLRVHGGAVLRNVIRNDGAAFHIAPTGYSALPWPTIDLWGCNVCDCELTNVTILLPPDA